MGEKYLELTKKITDLISTGLDWIIILLSILLNLILSFLKIFPASSTSLLLFAIIGLCLSKAIYRFTQRKKLLKKAYKLKKIVVKLDHGISLGESLQTEIDCYTLKITPSEEFEESIKTIAREYKELRFFEYCQKEEVILLKEKKAKKLKTIRN